MRFKKISTRMLAIIVPILILSMGILTLISVRDSSSTITEQINERMTAELSAAEENIEESLTGPWRIRFPERCSLPINPWVWLLLRRCLRES